MSPEVLRHTKEFFDMCKQEDPDAKVPMKVAGAHPEILMALKEIKLRFGKPRSPKPGQRPGNVKQPGPTFETFARARPEIAVLTNEESARTEMIQVEPIGTCVNRFHKAFVEKIKSVIKRQPRGTFVMTDQVLTSSEASWPMSTHIWSILSFFSESEAGSAISSCATMSPSSLSSGATIARAARSS
jgi:hypothetical protein